MKTKLRFFRHLFIFLVAVLSYRQALAQAPVPIARWTFDELRDGSVEGKGASAVAGTADGTKVVPGKIGNALLFLGEKSKLTIPLNLNSLNLTAITVSLWVNVDEAQKAQNTYGTLFQSGGSRGISIRTMHGTKALSLSAGGIWNLIRVEQGAPVPGQWVHVAASYDGKTARLYINGVPAGEKDATTQNLFGETIEIGQAFEKRKNASGEAVDTATGFFQGMIDDVRIYNSALTPAEVAALATGS